MGVPPGVVVEIGGCFRLRGLVFLLIGEVVLGYEKGTVGRVA